jgi:hypothetical protein
MLFSESKHQKSKAQIGYATKPSSMGKMRDEYLHLETPF